MKNKKELNPVQIYKIQAKPLNSFVPSHQKLIRELYNTSDVLNQERIFEQKFFPFEVFDEFNIEIAVLINILLINLETRARPTGSHNC